MSGGSRTIGLKELAAELGLSVPTVSRALGGYSDVAQRTRERVVKAAQERGYVANRIGRMLVSGRASYIGMVLPLPAGQIIDAFVGEFLLGLSAGLSERGRDLLVAAVPKDKSDIQVVRQLIDGWQADGVVINRLTIDDPRAHLLIEAGLPFVAHGRLLDPPGPYSWLDTDGEEAMAVVARILAGLGHRRFALLMPDVAYTYAHFRHRGLELELDALGLPLSPDRIAKVAPNDAQAAREAAQRLLTRDPRPTAIVALTDRLAFAVLEMAREMGILVPAEVSVVGFDNVPMAAYANPPLTTFDQEIRESGGVVGDMMVDRIERGAEGIETRLVQPRFVPRATHGPAPPERA